MSFDNFYNAVGMTRMRRMARILKFLQRRKRIIGYEYNPISEEALDLLEKMLSPDCAENADFAKDAEKELKELIDRGILIPLIK